MASALFDGGGASRDELEAQVADLMSLMSPSYLTEPGEVPELMRRLLLAGGVVVAAAHGDVEAKEKAALEKFFGPGTCDRLNVKALETDLERRAGEVKEKVPALKRQQVVRDLCVVALADGHASDVERELLLRIAGWAGVEAALVEKTLAAPARLD
ncbi:MAG: TerB family tellurite resistance protein [Myxococcales bacterium]|nr:TerB family tellurite resistance protein [Myxococcales bacterium]